MVNESIKKNLILRVLINKIILGIIKAKNR